MNKIRHLTLKYYRGENANSFFNVSIDINYFFNVIQLVQEVYTAVTIR
jgi:hypothetical protein